LRDVLSYLVRLAEPLTVDGETLPGWRSGNGPDGRPSPHWSGGHSNLGMAHGIAGPLPLLSTAMKRGITVTGQADAIGRICSWLDQWRSGTRSRPWWPGMISWLNGRAAPSTSPARNGRHGATEPPGLARAQQLAALALADAQGQRRAEAALAGCTADDTQLSQLGDASLCHGWAGLVQTTWRAAADAGSDSELTALLPHLLKRMEPPLHHHGRPAHDALLDCWKVWQVCSWSGTPLQLLRRPPPGGMPACCWTADIDGDRPRTQGQRIVRRFPFWWNLLEGMR
jgi:hypothetical protein